MSPNPSQTALMPQHVSKPFGTASDPVGLLAHSLFSFADSSILPFLHSDIPLFIPHGLLSIYVLILDPQSPLWLCIPIFGLQCEPHI